MRGDGDNEHTNRYWITMMSCLYWHTLVMDDKKNGLYGTLHSYLYIHAYIHTNTCINSYKHSKTSVAVMEIVQIVYHWTTGHDDDYRLLGEAEQASKQAIQQPMQCNRWTVGHRPRPDRLR